MTLRRSPLLWLNVAAVVLVAVWLWVAPRRAWDQFLLAVAAPDDAPLMARIDPALLSANMRSDLLIALSRREGVDPAVLKGKSETLILNPLVEAATSADGIRETVRSFQSGNAGTTTSSSAVSYRYLSPIEVEIRMHDPAAPPAEAGLFTFRFTGAAWRLIRVRSAWLVEKENT